MILTVVVPCLHGWHLGCARLAGMQTISDTIRVDHGMALLLSGRDRSMIYGHRWRLFPAGHGWAKEENGASAEQHSEVCGGCVSWIQSRRWHLPD